MITGRLLDLGVPLCDEKDLLLSLMPRSEVRSRSSMAMSSALGLAGLGEDAPDSFKLDRLDDADFGWNPIVLITCNFLSLFNIY